MTLPYLSESTVSDSTIVRQRLIGHISPSEMEKGVIEMSRSSKTKDYGGKAGGNKVSQPPQDNDCRPGGDNDTHHGALIKADVDADVSANVLQCNSLLKLDADIDACVGLDLGNDNCLV
jgi:hypothetical protein